MNAKDIMTTPVVTIGPDTLAAADYVRSRAQRAVDVMQREVVSVSEDSPVQKLAALLGVRSVRRIVRLRNDQLVGIVTRSSPVRALRLEAERAAGTTRRTPGPKTPVVGRPAAARRRRKATETR